MADPSVFFFFSFLARGAHCALREGDVLIPFFVRSKRNAMQTARSLIHHIYFCAEDENEEMQLR